MGRIAYLDLYSGISGDMLLGAFLDMGADERRLEHIRDELGLDDVSIMIKKKETGAVKGTDVKVICEEEEHRKFSDVIKLIDDSDLDQEIAERSIEVFNIIGEVEADIHDVPLEQLELHETGMGDSIIDIVGAVSLFLDLNIDEVYCSTVSFGSGVVKCSHGELAVPVPATLELLKGWNVNHTEREGELVTPTGAALLRCLSRQRSPPDMVLDKVGIGFGDREMDPANVLRIFYGPQKNISDEIVRLDFYIDDMNPEVLSYSLDRIRESAIDVYEKSAHGKKSRSGWEITVLCEKDDLEEMKDIIFSETSTLGIQVEEIRRFVSDREIKNVKTKWGVVRVKVSDERISPEYDDCKRLAKEHDVAVHKIYEEVRSVVRETIN